MTLKQHLMSAEKAYWEELLATGKTIAEIARIADRDRTHIYARLRALGVDLKPRWQRRNEGNELWRELSA